jgi:hypothetical protein
MGQPSVVETLACGDLVSLGIANFSRKYGTSEFAQTITRATREVDALVCRPCYAAALGWGFAAQSVSPSALAAVSAMAVSAPPRLTGTGSDSIAAFVQLRGDAEPKSGRNGLWLEHEEFDFDIGADVVIGDEDEHGAA